MRAARLRRAPAIACLLESSARLTGCCSCAAWRRASWLKSSTSPFGRKRTPFPPERDSGFASPTSSGAACAAGCHCGDSDEPAARARQRQTSRWADGRALARAVASPGASYERRVPDRKGGQRRSRARQPAQCEVISGRRPARGAALERKSPRRRRRYESASGEAEIQDRAAMIALAAPIAWPLRAPLARSRRPTMRSNSASACATTWSML